MSLHFAGPPVPTDAVHTIKRKAKDLLAQADATANFPRRSRSMISAAQAAKLDRLPIYGRVDIVGRRPAVGGGFSAISCAELV